MRALRAYDGSYEKFWEDFASRPPMSKDTDGDLVITYGARKRSRRMRTAPCICRSTCARDGSSTTSGARWLAWDPVRMVPAYAEALRGLRAIYLDGGTRDEWYLDLGALAFRDALVEIGVTDVACELFPTRRMAASTIATRAAWPTLRSACRATPDGARTGCMHAHGGAADHLVRSCWPPAKSRVRQMRWAM